MLALYGDAATMLPTLAMLFAPTLEAWAQKRRTLREWYSLRTAFFWDMVCARTGDVVGTSGFRSVSLQAGEAEWGCVVSASRRRAGLCGEALDAAAAFARAHLPGVHFIRASTAEDNDVMRLFLVRRGFSLAGPRKDEQGGVWLDYLLRV